MNNSVPINRCPACGGEVPAEAPHGLCPKCLLAGVNQPTATATPPPLQDGPPTVAELAAAFPQLQILEIIGQGGMGCVFKARQPKLERLVALKLLPAKLAADAAFRERFTREARVLARLNHPEIVTVYDFGEAGGFFYLLMEYVDGANLRQAMQAGRFSPAQALAIVPKICEALQFAHSEGILHRDIKPENILLDTKGRVKIADFGIAKLVGEARPPTKLTATGLAVGTPNYMAPEQLEHPEDVDQRADIYSLGVVFYEMLTGELPIGRFAPPSKKTNIDERVDDIVLRALARERELRQRSAGEVKTQVEQLQTPPQLEARLERQVTSRPAHLESSSGATAAVTPPAPTMRWSKKATAAAILSGIGLFPPFLLVVIAFYLALPGDHAFSMINARIQLLFAAGLSLIPALAGSVCGGLALADIRRVAGQIRGRRLAFCATLFWPLLLMDVLLVGLVVLVGLRFAVRHGAGGGIALMFFAMALLAALGLDLFLSAKVWRWATDCDVRSPGQRRSLVPVAAVLCVALALFIPCLAFASMVWMPMLVKTSRGSDIPTPIVESRPVREASMNVTTPPRQRFTGAWTVFSNNVPVIGPMLFTDLRTPAREPGQFKVQWRILDPAGPEAEGLPWEVIFWVNGTNRIVSHPVPGSLPNLEWTALAARQDARFTSSIEQVFDNEIFRAEPRVESTSGQSPDHWSVRLMLRSSSKPQLGTVTNRIGAQFTVPAGQVAVFEIVTRSRNQTVPIRNLGAYVIAPVDRTAEGAFKFTRDAEDSSAGTPRRPWRIEIATAGGTCSSGGLDLPKELGPVNGAMGLGLALTPDHEVVHWDIQDEGNPPADGMVGLRVRTQAHGLKSGMPRSDGASGTGTNWLEATSPK